MSASGMSDFVEYTRFVALSHASGYEGGVMHFFCVERPQDALPLSLSVCKK